MLQIFPRGRSAMKGGQSAMLQTFPFNVANLPPLGKVCNVADPPGDGLQCCRSSGGKVCNVADRWGEGLKGRRSAIQQGLNFRGFRGYHQQRIYIPNEKWCIINRNWKNVCKGRKNIVTAFRGMHVLPAKHSYAWLPRKCDYWTDRQTPDKVIPTCRYASQATQLNSLLAK